MTGRTRWDAIAEELAEPSKEPRPEPISEARARPSSNPYRSVLVTVNGQVIPTTNLIVNWTVDVEADYELMRLGVLTDEEVRRGPTKVTGSFVTTGDDAFQLSGRDLMILVVLGDETLQFLANVCTTKWSLAPSACEVTFVGTQVR